MVPATYSGSYTDVYPHNVPKDAKDLEIHFVDAATGKPAPAHPFPGQSWTAKIVGFETRGGEAVLHVHIDVTGTGGRQAGRGLRQLEGDRLLELLARQRRTNQVWM